MNVSSVAESVAVGLAVLVSLCKAVDVADSVGPFSTNAVAVGLAVALSVGDSDAVGDSVAVGDAVIDGEFVIEGEFVGLIDAVGDSDALIEIEAGGLSLLLISSVGEAVGESV